MCRICTDFIGLCVPTVHCTELDINFHELDYVVNEGDQQGSIVLRLREVQNSFTVILYPVSITEARDPAGFNVNAFIASVPPDAQATPGKGVVPSQKLTLVGNLWNLEWKSIFLRSKSD